MLTPPPPAKKTSADSQGGGILLLHSRKFGLLSPLPRVPGSTSNLPQKTLGMIGGLPWVCYSRGRNEFSCRDAVLPAIRLQDTGPLHVYYPGHMQLTDTPCPENASLHQELLSRVPACSLITLIYPTTSTAAKQEPSFPPCFVYENTHQLTRCLLAVIGFNSLSLLSIKSQENTGISTCGLIAYGNSGAVVGINLPLPRKTPVVSLS